jgi:hypothetical protein
MDIGVFCCCLLGHLGLDIPPLPSSFILQQISFVDAGDNADCCEAGTIARFPAAPAPAVRAFLGSVKRARPKGR